MLHPLKMSALRVHGGKHTIREFTVSKCVFKKWQLGILFAQSEFLVHFDHVKHHINFIGVFWRRWKTLATNIVQGSLDLVEFDVAVLISVKKEIEYMICNNPITVSNIFVLYGLLHFQK